MGPCLQAKLSLAQHFEPVSLNQSFCDVGSLWARMNLSHFPKTEVRPATLEISPRSRLLKRKKKKQTHISCSALKVSQCHLMDTSGITGKFYLSIQPRARSHNNCLWRVIYVPKPTILKCILRSLFHNPTRKSMQCWLTFSTVNFFLWYNFVSWV